jgi:hypothetical protein
VFMTWTFRVAQRILEVSQCCRRSGDRSVAALLK